MPVRKLRLQNFQAHKNTIIEFHEGINVIIGVSDSGKSSILRGVGSLLFRDSFYLRNRQTDGLLEMVHNDTNILRLIKIKGYHCPVCKKVYETIECPTCKSILNVRPDKDYYVINDTTYDGFGAKLTPEIMNKIGFCPVMFGEHRENLNFRTQHQDMFFIGESYTGGARNKIISSLIKDSDKIDILIKKLSNDSSRMKILIEEYESKNAERKIYLDEHSNIITNLEQRVKSVDGVSPQITVLQSKIEQLKRLQSLLTQFGRVITFEKNVIIASGFISKIKDKFNRLESLKMKLMKLKQISKSVNSRSDISIDDDFITRMKTMRNMLLELNSLSEKKEELSKFYYQFSDNEVLERQKKGQRDAAGLEIENCRKEIETFFTGKAICPIIQQEYCQTCKDVLKRECIGGKKDAG